MCFSRFSLIIKQETFSTPYYFSSFHTLQAVRLVARFFCVWNNNSNSSLLYATPGAQLVQLCASCGGVV